MGVRRKARIEWCVRGVKLTQWKFKAMSSVLCMVVKEQLLESRKGLIFGKGKNSFAIFENTILKLTRLFTAQFANNPEDS